MTLKNIVPLSILLIAFSNGASSQNMSFEEYNPVSTLKVPGEEIHRAKFPFIDVHGHQYQMPTQDLSLLIADMDKLNLAIMVNLSGGSGERIKQSLENIKDHYPNRFAVFANVDFEGVGKPGWSEKAVAQLEADIRNGAKGLKVYKSLGLRDTDASGKRLAVDDDRLSAIWEKCGEMGVPVLIHSADPKPFWDEVNADNERWLELRTHPRRKRSATDPAPWELCEVPGPGPVWQG